MTDGARVREGARRSSPSAGRATFDALRTRASDDSHARERLARRARAGAPHPLHLGRPHTRATQTPAASRDRNPSGLGANPTRAYGFTQGVLEVTRPASRARVVAQRREHRPRRCFSSCGVGCNPISRAWQLTRLRTPRSSLGVSAHTPRLSRSLRSADRRRVSSRAHDALDGGPAASPRQRPASSADRPPAEQTQPPAEQTQERAGSHQPARGGSLPHEPKVIVVQ